MSFFRIKKVKGNEYVYIVENEWKTKGSRQKVKEYIGKAYRFNLKNDIAFHEFIKIEDVGKYVNETDKTKIFNDLIEWEFLKSGISRNEFSVEFAKKEILKSNKKIALLINDGFLCSNTLKNLLEFKTEGNEENDGYRFARAFVESGIKVPQDVFIGLFGKLYKSAE